MNPAHIHLMVNHFPVIGFVFTFFLLAYALWANTEHVNRPALALVFIVGIFSAIAYLTGEPAEEAVENLSGISERFIEAHEEKAEVAFIFSILTAIAAIITLIVGIKRATTSRIAIGITLALNLVTSLFMGWTANLGGEIRHPEIRSDSGGSHERPIREDEGEYENN